ncbi:LysR family transcriptional regulator [Leptolyngbya sp. FACHB-261]|uniref:LysR family transcriptional regulator n=1 Tax=Leptolyngbya sp. FACHB-261 TaxID=2692806 RepID=UPI0016883B67|nr:LysR family transcriptional regulator [Leptolyngbya sp. FACHB-261]MBD2102844.1 LysR family transcriptional regulator [Leptolyngbya sp. FACHB-261]
MTSIDVSKIKLFQLRALVAVANCGSFGGAALKLDLTQSAISHAIASLEQELGVILLIRGRNGASLTYVGEQIIGEVRQMLQLLDIAIEKVNCSRGLQAGQVKIASIRSLATHWLPSVMAAFNQRFPQITVTLTKCFDYVEVQAALQNRSADLGLMDIDERTGFTVTEIGSDDYLVLLPANIALQSNSISWQQLSQYPLIMPAPNDQGYAPLRRYIANAEVPLTIAYEINEDSTIVSMVAQGLGIAILPQLAALPIPQTVQVCRPPQPLSRLLVAAILENALHSPAVFVFLELIEQMNWRSIPVLQRFS